MPKRSGHFHTFEHNFVVNEFKIFFWKLIFEHNFRKFYPGKKIEDKRL